MKCSHYITTKWTDALLDIWKDLLQQETTSFCFYDFFTLYIATHKQCVYLWVLGQLSVFVSGQEAILNKIFECPWKIIIYSWIFKSGNSWDLCCDVLIIHTIWQHLFSNLILIPLSLSLGMRSVVENYRSLYEVRPVNPSTANQEEKGNKMRDLW